MIEGGGRARDEGGREGEGWRGERVVWKGPGLVVTHVHSCIHECRPLFVSCGGCVGWWWFTHIVVRG